MKKTLIALMLSFVSIMSFGQITIISSSSNFSEVCHNSFGDKIFQTDDEYYLSLEFWNDNGLNSKYHPSAGYQYISLGKNPVLGLNQLCELMKQDGFVISMYTKDNKELTVEKDWQGGLIFRFKENSTMYSVIYSFRIKQLLKKLK